MPENYKNIIEQLNEGVYYVDFDKKITLWNKSAENITGFTSDEVMGGRRCSDNILRHVDELGGTELCLDGCPLGGLTMSDGQNREAKVYLHHKKGTEFPFL